MPGTARFPGSSRLAAAAAAALLTVPAGGQVVGLAARVNGVEITRERLDLFFEAYAAERGRAAASFRHPEAYKRWMREALDVLIEEELLWQESQRRGIAVSAKEVDAAVAEQRARLKTADAFARQMRKSGQTEKTLPELLRRRIAIERFLGREIADKQKATAAEIHDFYAGNPERFVVPEEVRARHILAKVEPAAPEERKAAARQRIEAALARVRAGEDFAELARRLSEDESAPAGGDLGFVARSRMESSFGQAASALRAGEISQVVETVFGYHVIQVLERRGGEPIPEERVAEAIRQEIVAGKAQRVLRALLDALRRAGRVEILVPL